MLSTERTSRDFSDNGLRVCAQEMRCFDALAELYTHLGEEDVLAGLWKRKSAAHETRELLAHLQHGLLERTQDLCLDSLERHKAGTLTGEGVPGLHYEIWNYCQSTSRVQA